MRTLEIDKITLFSKKLCIQNKHVEIAKHHCQEINCMHAKESCKND